jgi:YjbE family integral membrane protein
MQDWLQLLSVILVDIVLSGDNAILIAMATFSLPPQRRKSAIWTGMGMAMIIRICLTMTTTYLLQVPFLQAGAGFLLYALSLRLLTDAEKQPDKERSHSTWFGAVFTIVLTDITMSLDNILAVAGVSEGNTFIIIAGLLFSMLFLVLSSHIMSFFMERFHSILWIGGGILAWTAGKMIAHDLSFRQIAFPHSLLLPSLAILILLYVLVTNKKGTIGRTRS